MCSNSICNYSSSVRTSADFKAVVSRETRPPTNLVAAAPRKTVAAIAGIRGLPETGDLDEEYDAKERPARARGIKTCLAPTFLEASAAVSSQMVSQALIVRSKDGSSTPAFFAFLAFRATLRANSWKVE